MVACRIQNKCYIQRWTIVFIISTLLGEGITGLLTGNQKESDTKNGEGTSPTPPEVSSETSQGFDNYCTCVQYYLCNDNNTMGEENAGLIDIAGGNSEQCTSYLRKCCAREHIRPAGDPLLPKPKPFETNNSCGTRNVEGIDFRISRFDYKEEAKYGEFPWVVAVIRTGATLNQESKSVEYYQCGGSLIHPQVVLTGAHCIRGKDNLIIRAGEWDTQTKDELYPTQDRTVVEVIVHEDYDNKNLANDIALLVLESPVDMSVANVGLICLPQPNENLDGRGCIVSGWGKDSYGKEGRYSVILKQEALTVVPQTLCQEALRKTRLGSRFTLHDSFICAGRQPHTNCKGDGGGPLFCPSKNNSNIYVQAGIVSWGIDCGTDVPSVYVNVPYFINWIKNKMHTKDMF